MFIDETKLTNAAKEHLNDGMTVHIHPYDEIQSFLSNIYTDGKKAGKTWVRNAKGKICKKKRVGNQKNPLTLLSPRLKMQ